MSDDDSTTPSLALKGRQTANSLRAGFATDDLSIKKPKRDLATPLVLQLKSFVEPQPLLKAAANSMSTPESSNSKPVEQSNSQPSENTPSKMVSERRMIPPGSRDAPRFSSHKPEGLRRFITMMEDLWQDCGITKDDVKRKMIGRYADQDTEEQWAALPTFKKGRSWKECKAELIENYPEAAAAARGTPARLRQLCRDQSKVQLGDMPAIYNFRRVFMAEAMKLQMPPAAMANRELVELFMGCLADPLASAVLQSLGKKKPKSSDPTSTADRGKAAENSGEAADDDDDDYLGRRPEDKYDLEEVCNAAVDQSECSQVIFNILRKEATERGVFMFDHPISEARALNQKVEELEGVQALEKDRLVTMNKTLESKIGGIEDLLKSLLLMNKSTNQSPDHDPNCKGNCRVDHGRSHEASSGLTQKWGNRSMENEKCFWCGELGHYSADCPDQKEQIRIGNVKVNHEGKLRLRDGSFIPNHPQGLSMKERVARHYARKPSQFYYGEYDDVDPISPPAPKYAQYLGTSETAEQRIARLEADLELKKREEMLEYRRKKLEQDERKLEQSSGNTRATNALDLLSQLTEEEITAIKAARAGFT